MTYQVSSIIHAFWNVYIKFPPLLSWLCLNVYTMVMAYLCQRNMLSLRLCWNFSSMIIIFQLITTWSILPFLHILFLSFLLVILVPVFHDIAFKFCFKQYIWEKRIAPDCLHSYLMLYDTQISSTRSDCSDTARWLW